MHPKNSVTGLSLWHSAWSLTWKSSTRNNNSCWNCKTVYQIKSVHHQSVGKLCLWQWWKHIVWPCIDRVINTSASLISSRHYHWVINTSTHMINTLVSSTDWDIWQIYHWPTVHWIWNSMYSWSGIWEFVSFYCLVCEKSDTCLF